MLQHTSGLPTDSGRLFDICIVGGGVAGITLAMELRNTSLDVCLLESGPLTPHHDSQALYTGIITGIYAPDLDECRARYLGGSSNLWPGSCTPLDLIDFERRKWVYDGDWPFSYDEVAAYYPRAAKYCALRSNTFDPDHIVSRPVLSLDPSIWTTRRVQVSTALRFGERYADELRNAENITVLLGANVVRVVCEQNGTTVRYVIVQPFNQSSFSVRARNFVLAMGGIENARLMLASNDVHPQGIGNGNDLVGRFFMDHPVIHTVLLKPVPSLELANYASTPDGDATHTNYLQLHEPFLREHRMTNVRVHLSSASEVEMSPAVFSYRYLRLCLRRRRWPRAMLRRVARIAIGCRMIRAYRELGLTGSGGPLTASRPDRLRVSIMCEQLPHADNRVTLATVRDTLGFPRVRLYWRMRESEQAQARHVIDLLGQSFHETGIGQIRNLCTDPDHPFEEQLGFGNHAIGTTRASHDPHAGVVDRDCRVFGIDNLFVAGSSVFPTSSHVPPTLTIVALAIRMAEYLAQRVGHPH